MFLLRRQVQSKYQVVAYASCTTEIDTVAETGEAKSS